MRQAGRYMAEYRALRERHSLLEICRTPDLATEVTLQPIRRIDLDAAILFSDLLLPLEPMGLPFDFIKGEGPQLERPINEPADIDRLRVFEPREALTHVLTAIRQIQRELRGRVPLIGFAGAPFTLASYAIEGGHSNTFAKTKALMYGHPDGVASALREAVVDRRRLPRARRSTPASTRCRCSTRGSARSAPPTTASSRCPTRAASSRPSRHACRRFTSAPARRRSSRSCATPAAT